MHVAVNLGLALCVTLAVQPAHSADDERHSKNEKENCDGLRIITTSSLHVYRSEIREAIIPYGDSVGVLCQCEGVKGSRLVMMKQRKLLPTTIKYKTYIKWTTESIDLQERTEFTCTFENSVCESSQFILVAPVLKVISPNCNFDETGINCTIEYGNSISVLCSGPTASRLILTKNRKQLPTEHVNNNTINWFERTPDLQISKFDCTDFYTGYNRSALVKVVPLIYGKGLVYANGIYQYKLTYEDSTSAVFCSGPRAIKFVSGKNYSEKIFIENLNETTAKLSISSLELGKSVFACVDSEFSDYMSTVHVTVFPRMLLTSPNFGSSTCSERQCMAQQGDPLEIICTGPDAAELTLHYQDIKTERKGTQQVLNATSIKWSINKIEKDFTDLYICSTGEVSLYVYVSVLPHPEAVDFHCISHHFQYLNCTWSVPAPTIMYKKNFTLFYVDNGIPTRIYGEELLRPSLSFFSSSRFFVWHVTDYPGYPDDAATLFFIMQSCNNLGCFNQSFLIDHLSIVKLDPPILEVLYGADSRHAMVKWYSISIKLADEYHNNVNGAFYYRVEYQYPGMEPLEANSSLATCNDFDCFIKLTLPCPDQSYEVRVYHKIKKAVGEEYWSDPISGSVYIEAENDKMDIDDPTCIKGPRKTKDVMIYLIQSLRQEVQLFKPHMKEVVSSLQKKTEGDTILPIILLRRQTKTT